jgi:hypothetical protein
MTTPAILATSLGMIFIVMLVGCQPIQRESFPNEPVITKSTLPVDPISGDWEGTISIADQELIVKGELIFDGELLTGMIAVPQQGDIRMPVHDGVVSGDAISFQILDEPNTATFDGTVLSDGTFQGVFTQSGFEGEFTLQRSVAEDKATEPKPYLVEEVTFESADASLAGTLTLPQGEGPFPAVILVTGSGPQDRNEDLGAMVPGYKPFEQIADHLTREGMAVLRYDDRGVGESTGDFTSATTSDFADDARAALDYLAGRPEIDASQIGILGHSEGSLVAAMVATSDADLAYAINLSGPAVSGYDIMLVQAQRVAEASGAPAEQVAQTKADQSELLDAALSGDRDVLEQVLETVMRRQMDALTPEQRETIGDVESMMESNLKLQADAMLGPWMQGFLRYNPAEDWKSVRIPVLALLGEKDVQVDAIQNLGPFEAALADNPNADIIVIPNANHLYQRANTGGVQEYAALEPTLMPELFDALVPWLKENVSFALP